MGRQLRPFQGQERGVVKDEHLHLVRTDFRGGDAVLLAFQQAA